MSKLIMVSNRLPVKIHADGTAERTTGGLASALEGAALEIEQVWVGWPGGAEEDFEDTEKVRAELKKSGVAPVFLTQDELDGFYEGYSNGTLWPLLHYMVERARFSRDWWEAYRQVNEKFAEVIMEVADEGDQVWIHDYHLFLVPSLLRGQKKGLKVGFFLHTPFCTSEIFRVLPNRVELLKGVLGADVIGFHTYNYLRHFRSALLRVLGWESETEGMWHKGREVRMGVYPIGHNHAGFESVMSQPDFPAILEKHRQELAGKRMILNVERLDYTKGLPEKLAAMRRFLTLHPDKRDEVLFVLIAVPSRQGVKEYDLLTEEVQREVGAINGEFGRVGHSPIQFLHRGFPIADLAAFYALCEVCLVTPLRDGMNLVAKEFLDCQRPEFSDRPGVLILSEFAGAAQELSHSIQVNPYDIDDVAEALNRALEMPDNERRSRIDMMQGRLRKQDSGNWARRFLKDLEKVPDREERVAIMEMKPLAVQLAEEVQAGRKLGLFLDYDGTLRDFVDVPDHAVPDPDLPGLIRDLAAVGNISLAVVSGRPSTFLEKHLGGLGATLVGEHGYRWLDGGSGDWQLFNPHVNTEWKHSIREHLEQVCLLTPGTHMEEKQSALVWHYRKADPEFGAWRARGLLDELTGMAANLPVTVHHGQKIVEISSLQVSKGVAVEHFIKEWNCSLALVAGDDQTDETMIALEPEGVEFFAVKVGKGSTRATYRTDITGMRVFLEALRDELRR
ncbi:bifunctional alpha,alpha-trehalose-phosphate synthase (UDP-forming)/trehalose-phosphatase [Luteolibacter marinus]|uniref:bifunctional alpha,alpha-trehalose-phosphate synthase (UDP-forming)/trehalose-phosphatase n=1 Tax=Luteolibacter marinus TaxID=2776705 RepID=UPI001866B499|nr:bifunctional alpha,alpha-trehalose-phosphate synthase (UDP-forming)/trehalose-phosphatase [Luteolibacter marinus]